jgi:hypothetical protein
MNEADADVPIITLKMCGLGGARGRFCNGGFPIYTRPPLHMEPRKMPVDVEVLVHARLRVVDVAI